MITRVNRHLELLQSYDASILCLKAMFFDSFPDLSDLNFMLLFRRIEDLIIIIKVKSNSGLQRLWHDRRYLDQVD